MFSALGYAGNLGIIVGFVCIFVAFLSLAITLGGGANTRTHLELRGYHFKGNQVTLVTGGVQREATTEKKSSHPLAHRYAKLLEGQDHIRGNFDEFV